MKLIDHLKTLPGNIRGRYAKPRQMRYNILNKQMRYNLTNKQELTRKEAAQRKRIDANRIIKPEV